MKFLRTQTGNLLIIIFVVCSIVVVALVLGLRFHLQSEEQQSKKSASERQPISIATIQVNESAAERYRDQPFFLASWGKIFDSLNIEDLPRLPSHYGNPVSSAVVTEDAAYIANHDRIFKFNLNGALLGISNPEIVSSTRYVFRFRHTIGNDNVIYVLGNGRLVELAPENDKVVTVYDLSYHRFHTDVLAGRNYIWISHVGGLTQIDPTTKKIAKEWSMNELGFPYIVKGGEIESRPPSSLFLKLGPENEIHIKPASAALVPEHVVIIDELTQKAVIVPRSQYHPNVNVGPVVPIEKAEAIFDREYWPRGIADVKFTKNGKPVVLPTQLRNYYAMRRRNSDSFYLGSTIGLELLSRDSLMPKILARVASESLSADGSSVLLETLNQRYVAHLVLNYSALGELAVNSYQIVIYDTHTERHIFATAAAAGFEEFGSEPDSSFEILKGIFTIVERGNKLRLELNGRHILETHKP